MVVVDCLMFGALAAAEQLGIRCAVLVHSPPDLIMAPGGGMEGFLFGPVNDLRTEAGLLGVGRLWDCWAPFTGCARQSPSWIRWPLRSLHRSSTQDRSSMSSPADNGFRLGAPTIRGLSGPGELRKQRGLEPDL